MLIVVAIVDSEVRIALRHTVDFIILFVLPVILMVFFRPTADIILGREGYGHVNGSQQVVPGFALMFSLFVVGIVGYVMFREHGYGTWDRLRASPASVVQIIVGKSVVPYILGLLQLTLLLCLGFIFFGLRSVGPVAAVIPIVFIAPACFVSLGLAFSAMCRSAQQINIAVNAVVVLMGTLGGAFVPVSALPAWAQYISPAMPTYWAMRGFNSVFLDGASFSDIWLSLMVMVLMAIGFLAVWSWRFRVDERKFHW